MYFRSMVSCSLDVDVFMNMISNVFQHETVLRTDAGNRGNWDREHCILGEKQLIESIESVVDNSIDQQGNVLPSSCFTESYNLPSFKSKINKLDLISLSS